MKIYLIKTCGAFDYKETLFVEDFKIDQKTKGNAIIVVYNKHELTIPMANISCIEEK